MREEVSELFSVVIPCFETVTSVRRLAERLRLVFTEEIHAPYEIVFVDDGSLGSGTWETLRALAKEDPNVRAVRLSRNFGQHAATLCGLEAARGDFVVTMDDDLQHRPEDLPALVAERRHDLVVACFREKQHSRFKRATSRLKGWLDTLLVGKPRHIQLSSFRLLSRTVVDGMLSAYTPYPFIPALMFAVSRDVVNVPATHGRREEGETTYTLRRMVALTLNLLINNSALMLKIVGHVGVLVAAASFAYAGLVIAQNVLYDKGVPGWSSLIVVNLFIGGLLLFSVGVIGEYLVRIIAAVERKPMYWVRDRLG